MKNREMKILWNSNAPWSNSGYAQQMAYVLPSLQKDGWKQASIDFYGLEGGIFELDGVKHYPRMGSVWGEDAMVEHGKDFQTDITISQQDIWTLNPQALSLVKRWIPWIFIDHDPIPNGTLERARFAYRIVACSKFGQKQLESKGLHSTYIPLMVDTKVFTAYDKTEMRKALNIPKDVFLFGMVAANKDMPPRKSFQEAIDAFAMFHEKHPKSAMYFHVNVDQAGGFPIREYCKLKKLPANLIYYPPSYDLSFKVTKEDMAKIYSTFDVLLAPSTNEGFGVPIIEAQSCGVPVITNNFTSMPELIQPEITGELCDVLYKRLSPLASYVGVPSAQSIYEKMEKLFLADRKKMGMMARLNVMQYDTDYVIKNHWIPFLELVQKEVFEEDVRK